jgi:hypothetical protein
MKKYSNKMTNNKLLLVIAGIMIFFISCNDEFEQEKYKRPDWLAGKLYTQIKDKTTLSLFARCIERTVMIPLLILLVHILSLRPITMPFRYTFKVIRNIRRLKIFLLKSSAEL